MKNPLKKKSITDRIITWAEDRKLDQIAQKYGGYQRCPWCRQCAQSMPGWSMLLCDADPFLDVLTCGVCKGTSLWRFEIMMHYVAPLDPPVVDWTSEIEHDITKATEWSIMARSSEMAILKNDVNRLRAHLIKMNRDISQTLGKALGYPWFKDDQKNFPGTTEKDGVCIGEHVAESLAIEAANTIRQMKGPR